jgi:hypothetical protein
MLTQTQARGREHIPPVDRLVTGATFIFSEPGDGTRYTAAVVRWSEGSWACLGACGAVADGYLVVCGLNGKAYLLQPDGVLHPRYVAEKFALSLRQAQHFARLVGRALNRPVPEMGEED